MSTDGGGLGARFTEARRRFPPLDHLLRAWQHFGECRGNELAGAVTYFGFLSFFPIVALTFAVLGYVAEFYPDARGQVEDALRDYLPGLVGSGEGQIDLQEIASARASVGVIGIAGLVYAGLGWVNGLRESLRQLFLLPQRQGNIVVKKIADLFFLLLLGSGALVSLAVSSTASALTTQLLDLVGLEGSTVAAVVVRLLAPVLSILVTTAILLLIFTRLPGRSIPWREALEGALIGAVGLQVLLLLAGVILGRTTSNTLYGAFAVIVGLLVWMNLMARVTLLAAAWAATDRRVPPTTDAERRSPVVGASVAAAASGDDGRRSADGRSEERAPSGRPAAGGSAPSAAAGGGAGALLGVAGLVALRWRGRSG